MNTKKLFFNIIFLVICLALTFYYVLRGQDMEMLLSYMAQGNWIYWILAILCTIIFTSLGGVVIWYLLRSIDFQHPLGKCCVYAFVGFFFNLITPSAGGGQPMQIVYMKRNDIPIHVSGLVLLMVTITFKLVLVAMGAVVLIFRPAGVIEYLQPVMGLMYLGMALSVLYIAGLMLLVFNQKLAKRIVSEAIRLLRRFIKSKKLVAIEGRIDKTMESYSSKADYLRTHKRVITKVLGITLVQRVMMFMVTYFACLSFGVDKATFFAIVLLQAMINVGADMLPFPGGTGISEILFKNIFFDICGANLIMPVMIVSRGVCYYSEIIICAIVSLIGYICYFRVKRNKNHI